MLNLSETDKLICILETIVEKIKPKSNRKPKCIDFDLLDTETMAIDVSKLEAYKRAKPRSKIDKKDNSTPDCDTKYEHILFEQESQAIIPIRVKSLFL